MGLMSIDKQTLKDQINKVLTNVNKNTEDQY